MNNVRVGLNQRRYTNVVSHASKAHARTTIDQFRDLSKWLLISPFVISLIFLSAHFGLLLRYQFNFQNSQVNLAAEYGPWSYMLIHPIRPEIIKEIRTDRFNESKSVFQSPVKKDSSWVIVAPTEENNGNPPTHTPSPTSEVDPQPTSEFTITPTSTFAPTPTVIASPTQFDTPTPSPSPTTTPTGTPTITSTPTMIPTSTATPGSEFDGFSSYGVYPAEGTMKSSRGSITVWLHFNVGQSRNDHMVIHSDDSRWVLYIDSFYSSGLERDILSIAARAGGNKSSTSGSSGHSGFPEARLLIDNDGFLSGIGYGAGSSWIGVAPYPEGEWHHVTMTWDGYPSGSVSLYLDGVSIASLPYDPSYNDSSPLFEMISFGFKPVPWPGIEYLPEYGDVGIGRLVSGGIQAVDLRIYDRALTTGEILQIVSSGIGS